MGIRDVEIERLISYARGLGLEVYYDKTNTESAADWTLDGSAITIYTKRNKTKISTILSLIHELGHHLYFVWAKNRVQDSKFEEAITRQDLFHDDKATTPAPKKLREKIFQMERNSAKYWPTVYKDTNMKFPYWKLLAQMEFDVWQYECWAETGFWPNTKSKKEKFKQVTAAFKKYSKNKENNK
jgi:hypothetical protein